MINLHNTNKIFPFHYVEQIVILTFLAFWLSYIYKETLNRAKQSTEPFLFVIFVDKSFIALNNSPLWLIRKSPPSALFTSVQLQMPIFVHCQYIYVAMLYVGTVFYLYVFCHLSLQKGNSDLIYFYYSKTVFTGQSCCTLHW